MNRKPGASPVHHLQRLGALSLGLVPFFYGAAAQAASHSEPL